MNLDRQSIERRDFPISRRGYDPAAVDAHLRTLVADVEELERSLDDRAGESLGSAAGSQVQSILEAAEATASDIERQAAEQARSTREQADREAQRTRSEAITRAQAHVHAVSEATAVLLERVQAMDGEVSALVQSLRAGASRLAADLGAVETNMGELYDAAAGTDAGAGTAVLGETEGAQPMLIESEALDFEQGVDFERVEPEPAAAVNGSEHATDPASSGGVAPSGGSDDLDGARLIALNMALNGEPREQADRYLAENFKLPDRAKLLDEVYAAIEG